MAFDPLLIFEKKKKHILLKKPCLKPCLKVQNLHENDPPPLWNFSESSSILVASTPGPLKCFCAPRYRMSAKSAPQKARNRDKAKFATELHKLGKDFVNVNYEK